MIRIGLISLLIIQSCCFGQQNKLDLGLEGGPSIISMRGNKIISQEHDPALGFSGGIFTQYNFSKRFSLRTNISFERKGSIFRVSTIDPNGSTTSIIGHNNFNYMMAPVLLRLSFGNKVKFFVNAGGFVGYLISQIYKYDNFPTAPTTSRFKPFDAGVSGGLGLSIPLLERFKIWVEARDNLGLVNIAKGRVIDNGTIKTNSAVLLIGVGYNLRVQ